MPIFLSFQRRGRYGNSFPLRSPASRALHIAHNMVLLVCQFYLTASNCRWFISHFQLLDCLQRPPVYVLFFVSFVSYGKTLICGITCFEENILKNKEDMTFSLDLAYRFKLTSTFQYGIDHKVNVISHLWLAVKSHTTMTW